jgi:copper chaperone CopZ
LFDTIGKEGYIAMRKTIKLQDLGCANCAAKMERVIAKLDGVVDVKINFMTQKMTLEAPDEKFEDILEAAEKAARKIEPDVAFLR